MSDAASTAPMRGSEYPHPPARTTGFGAFAARLGVFLLASMLGTLWLFTLIVVVTDFSPYSFPSSWWPLAIGGGLTALLSGGVWLIATTWRRHASLARSALGLLVVLLCVGIILALTAHFYFAPDGWLLISVLAGAVAIVVTYLVAGLRVAPPPYQRYVNLGCGVASWSLVTALTLPVPDQGFTTLTLLGLPFAALGGLAGGALQSAFLGATPHPRPSPMPLRPVERAAYVGQIQHLTGQATGDTRRTKARGLVWRLIIACLLGAVAVPFGPGEPVTLVYSLLVLGFFAGIATLLDLSLLGWRPGLILLLCCTLAIAWGGGAAILRATGQFLFMLPTGAIARAPFAVWVSICALLCVLAVDGAHLHVERMSGERRTTTQLVRQAVFWLATGLSCWLGIAAMLLWRGAPGMLMGSETPGQILFPAALPLVVYSLPAALLGAVVAGALRWALTRGEQRTPIG